MFGHFFPGNGLTAYHKKSNRGRFPLIDDRVLYVGAISGGFIRGDSLVLIVAGDLQLPVEYREVFTRSRKVRLTAQRAAGLDSQLVPLKTSRQINWP